MLTGMSVFVLEDDVDTSELLAGSLRKFGAEVRSANTASAALAILTGWQADAILCDLHMPSVDGYEFLASLRATPQTTPVIAISASHPTIERERAIEAGFAQYLVKPTRMSEVVAVVKRVIQDNSCAATR